MKYLQQEIEVWYVLPALRREFALEMARQGFKGVEIAHLLGLTKAAVSQYFSKTRAIAFSFDEKIKKEIVHAVQNIIRGGDSNAEMQRITYLLRGGKDICKFHHHLEKIDPQCDLCFEHSK